MHTRWWRPLLVLLALGFAVHVLLPQVGSLDQTRAALRQASVGWLALTFLLAGATYVAATVAFLGSVRRRLPFWRTVAVQMASEFTGRLAPAGLGGVGTSVRYLQRGGDDRATAVAATGLNALAGVAVHMPLLLLTGVLLGTGTRDPGPCPTDGCSRSGSSSSSPSWGS